MSNLILSFCIFINVLLKFFFNDSIYVLYGWFLLYLILFKLWGFGDIWWFWYDIGDGRDGEGLCI